MIIELDFTGITAKTASDYLKIGEMLFRKFMASDMEKSMESYANWIAEKYINSCTPSTWRKYRRAAIYYAYKQKNEWGLVLHKLLLDKKPEKRVRAKRRKSKKSYSQKDFSRLLAYLEKKPRASGVATGGVRLLSR